MIVGGTRAIGLELEQALRGPWRRRRADGPGPRQRRGCGRRGARARAAAASRARRSTCRSPSRSPPRSRASVRSVTSCSSRSTVTRTAIRDYDIGRAIRLATLKLVGYTEVVHTLLDRLPESASLVLFGGMAKERPYPGSTTVSTVNGGVVGLTRSLVEELRPRRVNSLHPGIVGDSPFWAAKPEAVANYCLADADRPSSRRWRTSSARPSSCSRTDR